MLGKVKCGHDYEACNKHGTQRMQLCSKTRRSTLQDKFGELRATLEKILKSKEGLRQKTPSEED